MQAFHNDPSIKQKYLDRVNFHIEADNLIRGNGWDGEKGCAVGCTLEKYEHKAYEIELGIPEWLAYVEDTLFEGMSEEKSRTWPKDFLEAITPGVDLESVKIPFLLFVVKSTLDKFDHEKFPEIFNEINGVITTLEAGNDVTAAAAAAYYASRSAADAAYYASRSAAYSSYADELLRLLRDCKVG